MSSAGGSGGACTSSDVISGPRDDMDTLSPNSPEISPLSSSCDKSKAGFWETTTSQSEVSSDASSHLPSLLGVERLR